MTGKVDLYFITVVNNLSDPYNMFVINYVSTLRELQKPHNNGVNRNLGTNNSYLIEINTL